MPENTHFRDVDGGENGGRANADSCDETRGIQRRQVAVGKDLTKNTSDVNDSENQHCMFSSPQLDKIDASQTAEDGTCRRN